MITKSAFELLDLLEPQPVGPIRSLTFEWLVLCFGGERFLFVLGFCSGFL